MKKRNFWILSFVILMILLPLELGKASYSDLEYSDDAWEGSSYANTWAEENYNDSTDQYELKAWDFLGQAGIAWYEWDMDNNGDYLTADEIGTATLQIKWEFDGVLEGAGDGHLEFTYTLSGSGSPTLSDSGIVSYTEDESWTDDYVYHTFTTSTLYEDDYTVDCRIYLKNDAGSTSDFLDGGNGLRLIYCRLYR